MYLSDSVRPSEDRGGVRKELYSLMLKSRKSLVVYSGLSSWRTSRVHFVSRRSFELVSKTSGFAGGSSIVI